MTTATITPQEELAIALRGHLYRELAAAPSGKLKWVMSADWLHEVIGLAIRLGEPVTALDRLLGIPVEVRDGAGVPELVQCGEAD